MKKYLMIALLLLSAPVAMAQNSKLIIGNWSYVSLQTDGEVDPESKQMADMIFKDLTISFRPDNTMSLTMRKNPETGKYAFDKTDPNKIIATSDSGKEMNLNVVKLTESELTLTLDKAGTLVLKKSSDQPDAAPAPAPVLPKVAATAKQITGKWYVIGSDDKKMSDIAAELMKDSFVSFGANGKYDAKVLMLEQKGTWKFGEGNTTINVDMGEDGVWVWSIYKISNTELIMQNDSSRKRMIFSKVKP